MQQAAQGTQEVAHTIAIVAESGQRTGSAATDVATSLKDMPREQGNLRQAEEAFLTRVQARRHRQTGPAHSSFQGQGPPFVGISFSGQPGCYHGSRVVLSLACKDRQLVKVL